MRLPLRAEGLLACQPRPFPVTTEDVAVAAANTPDQVKRDFVATLPRFISCITYIHTWQGFIYLATLIDCYSKKVGGWSIADHMRKHVLGIWGDASEGARLWAGVGAELPNGGVKDVLIVARGVRSSPTADLESPTIGKSHR